MTTYSDSISMHHTTQTPPTTSGHIVQLVGFALSATETMFADNDPTTLA